MRRIFFRFLIVVLVLASIVSIVSCSSGSKEGASSNPGAVQMLKMLPSNFGSFGYYDIYKMRTDENLVSMLEFLQSELSLPEQINGLGILGNAQGQDLYLWEGNFSLNQMIGNNSVGSYNYEGFTIWTNEYYDSVAMSDNISMSGRDSTIKRCIDVVNGKADSMYDDVKDVVNRLPASFMIRIDALDSSSHAGYVYIMSGAIQGDNPIETEIYEFNSTEAAQQYTKALYNESTTSDVKRDGIFVTIVTLHPEGFK